MTKYRSILPDYPLSHFAYLRRHPQFAYIMNRPISYTGQKNRSKLQLQSYILNWHVNLYKKKFLRSTQS